MKVRPVLAIVIACVAVTAAECAPISGAYASLGRVQTVAETSFGGWISRDCGYSRSATRPGTTQTINTWVFCDTTVNSVGFNGRGSAANTNSISPGVLPVLGDHPSPGAPLLPDAGPVCWSGARPLLWTQGLGPARGGKFRIYYTSECPGNSTLSWGSVLYDPFASWPNQFSDNQRTVFVYEPGTQDMNMVKELGSPVERGAYTYFTARFADGSGIAMARVLTGSVTNGGAYQWFTGMSGSTPTWGSWKGAKKVPGMVSGFGVNASMDYYPVLGLYVAIEQVSSGFFGGDNEIRIFQTATPEDPSSWRPRHTLVNPGGCKRAGFCYAFIGHPELSTASQFFVSHYDSEDRPAGQSFGHVWAGTVTW